MARPSDRLGLFDDDCLTGIAETAGIEHDRRLNRYWSGHLMSSGPPASREPR